MYIYMFVCIIIFLVNKSVKDFNKNVQVCYIKNIYNYVMDYKVK